MAKLGKTEFVTGILKEELTQAIGDKVRVTNDLSADVLQAVATAYERAITEEQANVGFGNLGQFKTSVREARTYRNPQDGTEVAKPAQLTAKFAPSKAFKEALEATKIN